MARREVGPWPEPGAEGACGAGCGRRLLPPRPRARPGGGDAGGRRVAGAVDRAGECGPRPGRDRWTVRRSPRSWPDGTRRTGVALRRSRGDRPVSGFDLTFCAPKSVSVLHLLAPAELGAATGAAHGRRWPTPWPTSSGTVSGCVGVRSGAVQHLATTGAVAAGFVHRTSRALDPHLHTHLVAANVAQGVDGSWSSLDSRRLFLHRRATEAVYRRLAAPPPHRARPAWPGTGGRRADGRSTGSTRCSAGCSPSGPRRSTSTPIGPGPRVRRGPAGSPSMPTGRTRSGAAPSTACGPDWRRRADDAGLDRERPGPGGRAAPVPVPDDARSTRRRSSPGSRHSWPPAPGCRRGTWWRRWPTRHRPDWAGAEAERRAAALGDPVFAPTRRAACRGWPPDGVGSRRSCSRRYGTAPGVRRTRPCRTGVDPVRGRTPGPAGHRSSGRIGRRRSGTGRSRSTARGDAPGPHRSQPTPRSIDARVRRPATAGRGCGRGRAATPTARPGGPAPG